jgi:hypothetical protein
VIPFEQLRLWVRRAPAGEKATAVVTGLVFVGLLAWALVPGSTPSSSRLSLGGGPAATASGSPGAGSPSTTGEARSSAARSSRSPGGGLRAAAGTGPLPSGATPTGSFGSSGTVATSGTSGATAPSAGSAGSAGSASPGGTSSTGSASGAPAPSCPPGATDQGVSATEIHIGVVILNIEGQAGNNLVGVPSPSQQEADYQAVIAAIDRAGGVQCRRLVASFYESNPLDPSQQQATCLQMAQDRLFAAVSVGFVTPPYEDCPSQHEIPTFLNLPLGPRQIKQFYPYLFTANAQWRQLIRTYVIAVRGLGWFSGYRKIGVLEEDCEPNLNRYLLSDLAAIGIPSDRIVTYDYGCPTGLVPPNEVEEAVLSFKTAGVTNVTDAGTITENDFSKDAEAEDYHPRYSLPDGGSVLSFDSPEFAPDPTNFNGAIAITPWQVGALQTPGVPLSPATATCDQVMKAAGLPSAEASEDGAAGIACDQLWMLTAAIRNDASLTRAGLAGGLDRSGTIAFSYPDGPAVVTGPGVMTGGQFWRPDVYDGSCPCFKVLDATFRSSASG